MTYLQRLLLLCGLLTAALSSGMAAMATTSSRTITTTIHHCSVSYPSTWKSIDVPGTDLVVYAPDRNGFVSISSSQGSMSPTAMHTVLEAAFTPFGVVRSPVYKSLQLQLATGLLATGVVHRPNGATGTVYASIVIYNNLTYVLIGVSPNNALPTADADATATLNIIVKTRCL